jgi:hypothetical protein
MPDHERERLTEMEYEDYNSEALRIVHYRYDSVGLPSRNDTGDRGQVFFRSYCLSDECYRRVDVPTGRPGILFEAKRRIRQSGDGT